MSNTFFRGADCCVIVYDVTNRDTYEGVEQWKNNFVESIVTTQGDVSVPIILVGNKSDLTKKRQVEQKEVMADWIDAGEANEFLETSANTLKNISNLFESIAE